MDLWIIYWIMITMMISVIQLLRCDTLLEARRLSVGMEPALARQAGNKAVASRLETQGMPWGQDQHQRPGIIQIYIING